MGEAWSARDERVDVDIVDLSTIPRYFVSGAIRAVLIDGLIHVLFVAKRPGGSGIVSIPEVEIIMPWLEVKPTRDLCDEAFRRAQARTS